MLIAAPWLISRSASVRLPGAQVAAAQQQAVRGSLSVGLGGTVHSPPVSSGSWEDHPVNLSKALCRPFVQNVPKISGIVILYFEFMWLFSFESLRRPYWRWSGFSYSIVRLLFLHL